MSERVGIMLPTMFTEKLFKKLGPQVYVQPKIEGDRLRAILSPGKVSLLSSGGKERISIPHIEKELRECGWHGLELDGEIYRHGVRHSEIRSITSRTRNLHPAHEKMEYHIFDIIDDGESQKSRTTLLKLFFKDIKFQYLKYVPFFKVESLEHVQEYYQEFLRLGYEGIIIRSMYANYTRRKVTTILKLKPRVSEYFTIIDIIEEVSKEGVLKETFGAFNCVTKEGESFNVGSGPTDYQRNLIWQNRNHFIGTEVKIRFQDYTKVRRVPKLLSIDKKWLENL